MLLNSKANNFILNLPKGWIFPEVEEQFKIYMNRRNSFYKTLTDYINSTIQSVSFPSITTENIEQKYGNSPDIPHRGGKQLDEYFSRELTINFKNTSGYLNYWIMFNQLKVFYSYGQRKEFLPDIRLLFLDNLGRLTHTMTFKNIIYSGLSELELSYSSNVPEFRTFSITLQYSSFTIKSELDPVDPKNP